MLTGNLLALLDGEANLDGLKLHVLLQAAEDLGDVEALADLVGSHDGPAALIGDIVARLALLGGADALLVGLASVLLDSIEEGSASRLGSGTAAVAVGTGGTAVGGVGPGGGVHDAGGGEADEGGEEDDALHDA